MEGRHGYRRKDALEALAEGLAGKLPPGWRPAEEDAALEVWLTIDNATAVCGVRLSDRTMRHRTWKAEHRPASLRPTVGAAMVPFIVLFRATVSVAIKQAKAMIPVIGERFTRGVVRRDIIF